MADDDTTLTLLRHDALQVPSLVVEIVGPAGAARAPLGLDPLVVGTAADCDLVVHDARVSRQHARIALGERGIAVRDLDSKNGTFVHGVRVVEALVLPGVAVDLGSSRLTVHVEGTPTVVPLTLAASFGGALGGCLRMRALFAQLERAATTDAPVLLLGESGTGKEVLARGLHDKSPRRDGPFEVFDCSAVAASLVEGELFGWQRGAFTGAERDHEGVLARASGGTLFLDELGELPPTVQPKLLRALETGEFRPLGGSAWRRFDARLVSATHRDLVAAVASGAFRDDLYYRVAVISAAVPPLRQRRDDIPLLVERFLASQRPPRVIDDLPPGTMAMLLSHEWPGNVRELHNHVARLLVVPDLERASAGFATSAGHGPSLSTLSKLPLRDARSVVVERFERDYIAAVLREHAGNVSRAAESMGVSRQLLHRLLDRYAISRVPS